jgi:hypothetical protein
MVAEVFAGLSAIKTAFDIAKGLKDIDTAASRNAAVIELQEKILAAREAQTALLDRIGELEKEMARFETWEAEKKRYKLTDFGAGTFAYSLKPEEANGEPPHRICAACYQKNRKSILQFAHHSVGQDYFDCPECKTKQAFGIYSRPDTSGPEDDLISVRY